MTVIDISNYRLKALALGASCLFACTHRPSSEACAPQAGASSREIDSAAPLLNAGLPRLILQITVDQLRGDLPDKFMKNMGPGGFRFLRDKGVWFANAHYGYTNTETVVGHTTLATGADPAEHGMVSNVWLERGTGKLTYNIEDPRYHILSEGADVDKKNEIDSTQRLASTDGRSPSNILTSTFSDELLQHTNGQAKVFAVSVKDRGAVTLAGHGGKAFWFSKAAGEFITSSYYYDEYPEWVGSWHERNEVAQFDARAWELLNEQSSYLFGNDDEQSWEMDVAGFGREFPHPYGDAQGKLYGSFLTFSPAGDELTASFAKHMMTAEELGQDEIPDFLSISFSSTDYVGHLFGPSSLEAEDNLLRLDKTLASLFSYVDEHVGLENTLIVLSADHGGPDAPGYLEKLGIEAGYVSPKEWKKQPEFEALKKKFGVDQDLVLEYFPPYIYLDRELIEKKGLDLAEVEAAIANEASRVPGVATAVSSSALRANRLADTFLNRAALRGYNQQRSGDVLILFQPFHFVNDFDGTVVAANHGGPWSYDTHVPIVFVRPGVAGKRIYREVDPKDIALTLSAMGNIKSPSGATGSILQEVMAHAN